MGRDANNQMYAIAWVVIEIKNTDSWKWFLALLEEDLDMSNNNDWILIYDQQKVFTF